MSWKKAHYARHRRGLIGWTNTGPVILPFWTFTVQSTKAVCCKERGDKVAWTENEWRGTEISSLYSEVKYSSSTHTHTESSYEVTDESFWNINHSDTTVSCSLCKDATFWTLRSDFSVKAELFSFLSECLLSSLWWANFEINISILRLTRNYFPVTDKVYWAKTCSLSSWLWSSRTLCEYGLNSDE